MVWLTLFLLYAVVCYLLMGWSLWACHGEGGIEEQYSQALQAPTLWQKVFSFSLLIVAFLAVGLFMPLIFLHCLWDSYQQRKYFLSFARKHGEAILDPIAQNQIHPAGLQLMAELESEVESLQFEVVNHYLYKAEPLLIQNRVHLSHDRRTLLSVGHIDGESYCSLVSVLDSGAFVETTLSRCTLDMQPYIETGQVFGRMFDRDSGDYSISEIYAAHEQQLAELSQTSAGSAMEIERAQTRDVLRYVNRKFSEVNYQLDRIDAPPPSPLWPFASKQPEQPIGIPQVQQAWPTAGSSALAST